MSERFLIYRDKRRVFPTWNLIEISGYDTTNLTSEVVSFEDLPKTLQDRLRRFRDANGAPKHIRVYDNGGKTADRFTCVFTGNYRGRNGLCRFLNMSKYPFSPLGVGMHGECQDIIDRPTSSHLGKRVKWDALPFDVQVCIWQDYADYWEIPVPEIFLRPSVYVKGE